MYHHINNHILQYWVDVCWFETMGRGYCNIAIRLLAPLAGDERLGWVNARTKAKATQTTRA